MRVLAARGTFLNPDEALHFSVANQNSFLAAYHASFTVSHPPLLIFVLYFWRALGTSEPVLRFPSILAGTAFCWVLFKWTARLFGRTAGWTALVFASFLPPIIALSAEVRQYALLLLFAACTAYFLERALEENSTRNMLASLGSLYLALLSHYSAALFAAALGAYCLLRVAKHAVSRRLAATWAVGQAAGVGLCAFLYLTSLREQARFFQRQLLHSWMGDTYLHNSYFDAASHNPFLFVLTRTGSVFQYLFGQSTVGDGVLLVFIAGIVLLLRDKTPPGKACVSPRMLAVLLLLPFALNCAAGLAGVYPYGGTRHCVFLALFALAGTGFLIAKVVRQRLVPAVAIALVTVVVCSELQSRRLPYMARADQDGVHMKQAVHFVKEHIPASDLLFMDNQSSILFAHYFCQQQPAVWDNSVSGFQVLTCGGHHIMATDGDTFLFTAENFFPRWEQAVRAGGLKPGDQVWVLQAGWLWGDSLAQGLQKKHSSGQDIQAQSFGRNVTIFKLTVGSV